MRHLLISFFCCILISCEKDPVLPEALKDRFVRNYGGAGADFGWAVISDASGNIYLAGSTKEGSANEDGLLIKTDPNGNRLWSRSYGGSGQDIFKEILFTADGNLLIAGTAAGNGLGDFFFMKADTSGNVLWMKSYGGTDFEYAEDILQTGDGGYLVTGTWRQAGEPFSDIWLLRLDPSGDTLWSRSYGDSLNDGGASLTFDNSGNILLLGFTDNYGALNRDLYLMKLNSNGDSLGSWRFGGPEYEEAQSIERNADGTFIICGHSASFGHPEHNAYGLCIDGNGNILWENNYGGMHHDGGEHAIECSGGGFIFAGTSSSFGNLTAQIYAFRTDASGNQIWQQDIGGNGGETAANLCRTSGGYLMVGTTFSITNGNYDVFLLKIPEP